MKQSIRFILILSFALLGIAAACNGTTTPQPVQAESEIPEQPAIPARLTGIITPTPSMPVLVVTPLNPAVSGTQSVLPTPTPRSAPLLDQFVQVIMNKDKAQQVVGVYVENVLALRVVQQPPSNPSFVSGVKNVATYFNMVHKQTGNQGLLAHNYLAGIHYYDLEPGQVVILIYGDGTMEEFVVSDSQSYQATNPTSPSSSFINIVTGEKLTSTTLFKRVYGGGYKTTFQTCIAEGNQPSWGRLFVIAPQD